MDLQKIETLVSELLTAIGEDPGREGLLETPARVARLYADIFSGLKSDPEQHIKLYSQQNIDNEIICVRNIDLRSVCEHHLLPFIGKANIAYIPSGKVLGLSKFARIVNCFACRPQIQERLTNEIADFIFEKVSAQGVAVFIEASHLCVTMRGVKSADVNMQTQALRGLFLSDQEKRREVLSMFHHA